MILLAGLAVAASWAWMSDRASRGANAANLVLCLTLAGAVVAAYQFPLHIRPNTKLYMSSVPFYLLAVLVTPPLAAVAAAAGALVGETSVRARRGTLPSQIATEVGRRAIVVLLGAMAAWGPGDTPPHSWSLVWAALVLGVGDVVTFPLVLAGVTRQPFVQLVIASAREAYLLEGAQYLLGLLGALAAAQQLWAPALLILPTALVYITFKRAQEMHTREREARAQVEGALRVRDDFLMAASHDLRTPLTAIQGFAELVRMRLDADPSPDTTWLHAQMDRLYEGAIRMTATVDDITDMAQLQIGHQLALRVEAVEMAALVRETIAGMTAPRGRADAARVIVHATGSSMILGDRRRLERVLQNVIGNAIKYSQPGKPVHVTIERHDRWVTLRVRDRGVGIPPDDLPHIFDLFYRASTAQGIMGSGIGLAGAKAIIEQHGGQITVESEVGRETTITIRLPAVERSVDNSSASRVLDGSA